MSDLGVCMVGSPSYPCKNKPINGYNICEKCKNYILNKFDSNDDLLFSNEEVEEIFKIKLKKKFRGKEFEYIWVTYSPKSDDVQELLKTLKKFLGGSNIFTGVAQVEWGNWENINDPKNLHFHAIIRLKSNNRFFNLTRNRKFPAWKFVKLKKTNDKYEMDNWDYYIDYMTGKVKNEEDKEKNSKKELDRMYRKKLNIDDLIKVSNE